MSEGALLDSFSKPSSHSRCEKSTAAAALVSAQGKAVAMTPCRPNQRGPGAAQQRAAAEREAGGEYGAQQDGAARVHHPLPGGLQRLVQRHLAPPRYAGESAQPCSGTVQQSFVIDLGILLLEQTALI